MLALKPFAKAAWSVDGAEEEDSLLIPPKLGYLRLQVFHPPTRIHVRLLGPCFKTGRLKALRQHLNNREDCSLYLFTPWSPKGIMGEERFPHGYNTLRTHVDQHLAHSMRLLK